MNKVFYKGTDGIVIPDTRVPFYQQFSAPGWTDLRLGWFLSLTKAPPLDDTITTLTETIAATTDPQNRYWIGVRNAGTFPRFVDTTFIGFTNSVPVDGATETSCDSVLATSDIGLGTTNANYWRPRNSISNNQSAMIIDNGVVLAGSTDGVQQHFPQNVTGAGGYAVLLALRLLRDTPTALEVNCSIQQAGTHSADMLYSSEPTEELILDTIRVWPTGTQVLNSVVDMSEVPTGLFFYWPWEGSRLRIHAVKILKSH